MPKKRLRKKREQEKQQHQQEQEDNDQEEAEENPKKKQRRDDASSRFPSSSSSSTSFSADSFFTSSAARAQKLIDFSEALYFKCFRDFEVDEAALPQCLCEIVADFVLAATHNGKSNKLRMKKTRQTKNKASTGRMHD
jgi:hypothetical protein